MTDRNEDTALADFISFLRECHAIRDTDKRAAALSDLAALDGETM
jgi:hypothetical protein